MEDPKEPNTKGMRLLELDTWKYLVSGEEWRVFLKLLFEHRTHLEKQVLVAVKNRDIDGAIKNSAKAEDIEAIVNLITNRLDELKKED